MLSNFSVHTQIGVTDLEKSRDFYENKLKLNLLGEPSPGHASYQCADGTSLTIYSRPKASLAPHTLCVWNVSDIKKVVGELKTNGVPFEDYDNEHMKTVDSIASNDNFKAAWFKDPDQNILGLFELMNQ